jgi:transketolase
MICAKQELPALRRDVDDDNLCRRGGYVLLEAEGGARAVTLLATGSEVAIAVTARELLQAGGIPTAVASLPCWELFDAQDADYRQSVLGDGVRVGVEAAVRFGWDQYLGARGDFVGMTGFGASGPVDELYELFGITPAAVAAAAKKLL